VLCTLRVMVAFVGLRCRPVALADPLRHPIRLMLGDRAQMVGKHPPADLAHHPILAVIVAAIQPCRRLSPLIRPSMPARQFRPSLNHLWRSCACGEDQREFMGFLAEISQPLW
jgi:hypothetical protein